MVLRGADGEERFARVKVPKILPRWVPLHGAEPVRAAGAGDRRQPRGAVSRASRSSAGTPSGSPATPTFEIDHDEAEDLLSLIQEEVRNRRFGEVVRLEVHRAHAATRSAQLLLAEFNARAGQPAPPAHAPTTSTRCPACSTPPTS